VTLSEPIVSVILASYGRESWLHQTLCDVVAQLPEWAEVLVINQSASDSFERSRAYISALNEARITQYSCPKGLPGARNMGIEKSRAPVLIFFDDDVRLHEGCIQAHLDTHAQPGIGGVVGRIVEHVVQSNSDKVRNSVGINGRVRCNLDGDGFGYVDSLTGANMSIKRAVFEQIGPFDSNYLGTAVLEESDVSIRMRRAGWRIGFQPAASLEHFSASEGGVRVGDALRTQRWRFHNAAYYVRQHHGLLAWPALSSTFLAIALKHALRWRKPTAVLRLMRALGQGWKLGEVSPDRTPFTPLQTR
jgi:GT2 family glycosyltransferase